MQTPAVYDDLLTTERPVLRAIVLALGESGARDWLRAYGGGWVYIPPQDDEQAHLRISLSAIDAARLIDALEPHLSAQRYVLIPAPRRLAKARGQAVTGEFPEVDPGLLESLPSVLRAIVKALGYARASEWLQDHGGINIHIPLHKPQALGLEAAELNRLRQVLQPHLDSNQRLWCPKADKLLAKARNACIINNADRESIAQQARIYKLSSRQITNIRGEGINWQQADLFGDPQ